MSCIEGPSIITDGLIFYIDFINDICFGGGDPTGATITNIVNSSNTATVAGSGVLESSFFNGGLAFNATSGQGIDFGVPSFGTSGSIEATITYWIYSNVAPNHFGAAPMAYYFAIDGSSRLLAMIHAKNAAGVVVNDWPTTTNIANLCIGKPSMVTAVLKEDNYFKWYINDQLVLTRTPPYFDYLRFHGLGNHLRMGYSYSTAAATTWNGEEYAMLAYNKELTEEEIAQNFNAMRGRYGL